MRKLAFTGIVLQPSVGSGITVLLVTFGALFVSLVNLGGSSDTLFRILLGSDSTPELFDTTKSLFSNFGEIVFSNPLVNKLLFFSFWLFIGLVVYVFISGAGSSIGAAQKLHEEEKLLHMHKKKLEQEFMLRLLLRGLALSAWVLYTVIFMKLLLPFAVLSFQVMSGNDISLQNIAIGCLGFTVLALALHLHVVFLRCFLLRPRTIGGWDDVLAARLT